MKIKNLVVIFLCGLVCWYVLVSCDNNDDTKPNCNTFSKADSVCFCQQNGTDENCIDQTARLSLFSEETVTLTPHSSNGTLWAKGFVIDNSIYLIDRESASPHAFWTFELSTKEAWQSKDPFPGTGYGLIGAANGKGYVGSYASNKFWEYDPEANKWTALANLPFTTGETHWIEYQNKFYVPVHNGIYEFDPVTKSWTQYSNQTSDGNGALYRIGNEMFWYNINNDHLNRFNLDDKSFATHALPEDFGWSVAFNAPFVIGDHAYVVTQNDLWTFDNDARTWSLEENVLPVSCYGDDVFVIEGKAYVVYEGEVYLFRVE